MWLLGFHFLTLSFQCFSPSKSRKATIKLRHMHILRAAKLMICSKIGWSNINLPVHSQRSELEENLPNSMFLTYLNM